MAQSDSGLIKWVGPKQSPGDFWGGLAAMLVALPSAIAFGVTIYSAIAPGYAAMGALAGIIGATVIGLVAATLGGTDRLISAPCAPAAAVLTAFAIELVGQGNVAPGTVVLLMVIVGALAGGIQMLLGLSGVGRLIKYVPYPVLSGYLSGVGLIIIGSQVPKLAGVPGGTGFIASLLSPWLWDWRALGVGAVTILVTVGAHRLTAKIPGTILGILAGTLTYFLLALQDAGLQTVAGNPLVVGALGQGTGGYLDIVQARWHEIGSLHLAEIASLLGSALTLAALLSIDTLKTCVVVDQLTRGRHDPNRELVAQGTANIASAVVGGIPGAGTMGATMVNLNSGAQTRASGVLEGLFSLVAALALGSFVEWIPIAALAGILIVTGFRMIDREPLYFVESRATVFDFAVVASVIVVALTVGLIAASGVGVAMAILLFLREQIGGRVVRRKVYVNQRSSTWHRPESEMRIIEKKGDQGVIFELQGSLFFGTTQQLYADIQPELARRTYFIFDLSRVQSVDVTAAHLLLNVRDTLRERGAMLLLSEVREVLPSGRNLRAFLEQMQIIRPGDETVRVFPELDNAIEWVEERLLGEIEAAPEPETPAQLHEMELFSHHRIETLQELEARMELRHYRAGEVIYSRGEDGKEIYWLRRGVVQIFSPLGGGRSRHTASFGRGDFFGGLAFLDGGARNNDAVAQSDAEVYVLSRETFYSLSEEHKKLAFHLIAAIARSLAIRLRHTDAEMAMLREY